MAHGTLTVENRAELAIAESIGFDITAPRIEVRVDCADGFSTHWGPTIQRGPFVVNRINLKRTGEPGFYLVSNATEMVPRGPWTLTFAKLPGNRAPWDKDTR